jgi:hypothetical protein
MNLIGLCMLSYADRSEGLVNAGTELTLGLGRMITEYVGRRKGCGTGGN